MDNLAKAEDAARRPARFGPIEIVGLVLLVIVMLGIMVGFYYYPWPHGGRPTVGEFIAFFFRELITIIVLAVAVVTAGALRVWKAFRRSANESGHAL